jgi:hypothetical protein
MLLETLKELYDRFLATTEENKRHFSLYFPVWNISLLLLLELDGVIVRIFSAGTSLV